MDIKRLLHGSRGDSAQKTKGSFIAYIQVLVVIALGLAPVLIILTEFSRGTAEKPVASPRIFSFEMTPNPAWPGVRPGETVTLTWKTNAERVYLIANSNDHPGKSYSCKNNCFGGLPGASGSYSVQIGEQTGFTLYTIDEALPTSCMDADLTHHSDCSEMVRAAFGDSAYVSVVCSPDSWFFPDSPQACPARDAAELEPQEMVMQAFAGGTVILAGETEDLYVLYRDGTNKLQRIVADGCGGYHRQCNWDEMWAWLLAKNPDRRPPAWGEEEAPKVIDELGPAQASEIHYTGYRQCVAGEGWNCYISGPNASVYHIFTYINPYDNGWWRLEQQPSPNHQVRQAYFPPSFSSASTAGVQSL